MHSRAVFLGVSTRLYIVAQAIDSRRTNLCMYYTCVYDAYMKEGIMHV